MATFLHALYVEIVHILGTWGCILPIQGCMLNFLSGGWGENLSVFIVV